MSEFYKKLVKVQGALNAPKSQQNSFGGYAYRSCEDILEALKPLLAAEGLFQSITDEIVLVGDRYYIKAIVAVTDGETTTSAHAMAREADKRKGMDDAQLTGSCSSYARKYALNGMWCIDDCKDADTNAYRQQTESQAKATVSGFDPDAYLKQIEPAIACSPDMAALKSVYVDGYAALGAFPDHQKKLTAMKDQQKTALESN